MRDLGPLASSVAVLSAAAAASLSLACGTGEPRTDAERLARGREIVQRMSATLGATPAFSVTTTEIRDEIRPRGGSEQVTLTRETTLRRPDRFYSTVSGGRHNEVWYDGVGVTLVLHNERVFGQIRAPETLDKTLDAIYERFGVSTPIADFAYTSPAEALLTETTTGGWVGRETVGGQQLDHMAFKDTGVSWEIWIPAAGDPLPQKAAAEFTHNKHLRKVEMTFKDWNLKPQIAEDRFSPTVPADYEGIAIIQRARVLRNLPKEEGGGDQPAAGGKK
jgi:hypothetical protein